MTATPASDGDIIAGSLHDPDAFVALFERHFRELHRYLARRVGGELADDLAAEAFAEAFRVRGRYRPLTPDARPWLYGIAANLLFKHRRGEARRLRALARTRGELAHDDADGALERVDAAALAPRVAAALRGLAPRDREVLLLFAWAELGYAEIAVALAIPVGTVRSRLSRARAQVRRELGDHDDSAALPGVADPVEGAARA
ncbi:MAG TPA: RNA polymerase sigma factor [Solirubrobacteraceae bacterium]|nr:RNA polymerase sigma factor [Solirubrobacteraceae bacterium]